MAKQTLSSLKKCPTDFLYLWATDSFISQLGSKGNVIKKKRYYQYQTLWKVMAENSSFSSTAEGQKIYNQWLDELGKATEDIYGITPVEILQQLALGKTVAGKNFEQGVYGIGASENKASGTFAITDDVLVNPQTGRISKKNGKDLKKQTPIYAEDGSITGYSVVKGGIQYQSVWTPNGYVAYTYSDSEKVMNADGTEASPSKSSFWQNENNYKPIIDKIIAWVDSIINMFVSNRTVLTTENTVPAQKEWVEEDYTWLWIAGGLSVGGILLWILTSDRGKKKESEDN